MDQGAWESFRTGVTGNLLRPLTRTWRDNVADDVFDDGFVDVVNERLEDIPVQTEFLDSFRRPVAD